MRTSVCREAKEIRKPENVGKSETEGMEAMEDYTTEMAQVMSGDVDMRGKDGELLEEEMKLQFMNPDKFTWREG